MRRHVEDHQRQENKENHKYWRLHLPMLLTKIKKGSSQKNMNTNNAYSIDQNVKMNTNVLLV